jgi:hypothetical protein
MKTSEFNSKAPFYFEDLTVVFKKDGSLRQSKKLVNIIKENHSTKMVMSGMPKFYMRVDSAQMNQFGNVVVMVAAPDLKGGYTVKFLED